MRVEAAQQIIADLEAERDRQNLSIYALAKLAGMSPIAVTRVLSGDRQPKLDTVVRLARALGKKTLKIPPT
jgi:transcriptional regulator with XRE-family HTH domain